VLYRKQILKIANRSIKSLLLDFYTSEELTEAIILLKEIDKLNLDNALKNTRNMRSSVTKGSLDLDDILAALTFLDEKQLLNSLPCFVSTSLDRMPSIRLVDGDILVLWGKLASMEDNMCAIKNAYMAVTEC